MEKIKKLKIYFSCWIKRRFYKAQSTTMPPLSTNVIEFFNIPTQTVVTELEKLHARVKSVTRSNVKSLIMLMPTCWYKRLWGSGWTTYWDIVEVSAGRAHHHGYISISQQLYNYHWPNMNFLPPAAAIQMHIVVWASESYSNHWWIW